MNAKISRTLAILVTMMGGTSMSALAGESTAAIAQPSRQIDPASLARAQQKLADAERIAAQFTARASDEGLAETWHTELLSALMSAPRGAWASVQAATSATHAVNQAQQVAAIEKQHPQSSGQTDSSSTEAVEPKSLGSSTIDLTFIPLPVPCRIVDTRVSGAGGTISAGSTRRFQFNILSTQGSSNCSPFTGYAGYGEGAAAAVNITVVSAATAVPGSYLQAFPDGAGTTTSWLNFGPSQVVANSGVLGLSTTGFFDVTVNGATDVIVDAFGTFITPQATALDCQDTTKVTGTLPATGGVLLTSNTCPTGYTIVSGSCFGGDRTSAYSILEDTATATGAWLCTWKNTSATAQSVAVSSHCCRVPGR